MLQVFVANHMSLKHQLAEPMALLLGALQKRFSFSHILAPGTTFGEYMYGNNLAHPS